MVGTICRCSGLRHYYGSYTTFHRFTRDASRGSGGPSVSFGSVRSVRFRGISFGCRSTRGDAVGGVAFGIGGNRGVTVMNRGKTNGAATIGLLYNLCCPASNRVLVGKGDGHSFSNGDCFGLFSTIFRSCCFVPVAVTRGVYTASGCSGRGLFTTFRGTNVSSGVGALPSGRGSCVVGSMCGSTISFSNNRGRGLLLTGTVCGGTPILVLSRPATTLSPVTRGRLCLGCGRVADGGVSFFVSRHLSSAHFYSEVLFVGNNQVTRDNARRRLVTLGNLCCEVCRVRDCCCGRGKNRTM